MLTTDDGIVYKLGKYDLKFRHTTCREWRALDAKLDELMSRPVDGKRLDDTIAIVTPYLAEPFDFDANADGYDADDIVKMGLQLCQELTLTAMAKKRQGSHSSSSTDTSVQPAKA